MIMSKFDVCALGELLIDFTDNGNKKRSAVLQGVLVFIEYYID